MLKIAAFTFNPFQENTYIISNENKDCWIVDPGMMDADEERILFTYLEQHSLVPRQIINTHAHIDHILGIDALKQKYGISFGMHELEKPVLANAKGSAMLFGIPMGAAPTADFFIKEDQPLRLGGDEVSVRLTPGHSPGSIAFYYEPGQWVIGGDVLFNGSVGRTDLPGGNHEVLMQSIAQQMYSLPDATTVYSGHGPVTTIGQEKRTNPFIRG